MGIDPILIGETHTTNHKCDGNFIEWINLVFSVASFIAMTKTMTKTNNCRTSSKRDSVLSKS